MTTDAARPVVAPSPAPAARPRVGVVIGAGGVKCAAGMGMWKVLAREGIPIDVVVGCSGGALYTAGMALGYDVAEAERHTRAMWRDLFGRFHVRSVLRVLLPKALGFSERVGLIDDRRIAASLHALYGDATFADCRIPLHLAATDAATGAKVTIDSGPIARAVRASVALPLLLRPQALDGRLLLDGGLSNPLPIDVAIREGCDVILAMGFENPLPPATSIAGAVGRISTMVTNHLLRATYAFYAVAHHAEVIPILPQLDRRIGIVQADAVPELIVQGERATEEIVPYLTRVLAAGCRGGDGGVRGDGA